MSVAQAAINWEMNVPDTDYKLRIEYGTGEVYAYDFLGALAGTAIPVDFSIGTGVQPSTFDGRYKVQVVKYIAYEADGTDTFRTYLLGGIYNKSGLSYPCTVAITLGVNTTTGVFASITAARYTLSETVSGYFSTGTSFNSLVVVDVSVTQDFTLANALMQVNKGSSNKRIGLILDLNAGLLVGTNTNYIDGGSPLAVNSTATGESFPSSGSTQ
ncbi:MAG: hypothetical protein GY756_06625 [bacterium]|nr:hypothetical protein [bacterium]